MHTLANIYVLPSLCVSLGTIFLNAGKVKVVSPVLGETVTVNASVCPHEINKFHFIWHRDNMNLHYENHLSYTFQALKPSFCMYVAVSPSSGKELYNSRVFRVYPTGSPPSSQSYLLIHHCIHKHILQTCAHTHTHTRTNRTHAHAAHSSSSTQSYSCKQRTHIPYYTLSHMTHTVCPHLDPV